jgi:hypothetical protein
VVIDASDAATADAVAESSGCCSTVGDLLQHKSSRPCAGYTLSMQLLQHATYTALRYYNAMMLAVAHTTHRNILTAVVADEQYGSCCYKMVAVHLATKAFRSRAAVRSIMIGGCMM